MIADYSAKIKIAIFQTVSECHGNGALWYFR